MKPTLTLIAVLLLAPLAALHAAAPKLLPPGWNPALAGDVVLKRLVKVTAPQVKGAHDAEFVCVGDRAYVVSEVNDLRGGEDGGWPFIYSTMSIVNLKTLATERVIDFAKGEQAFVNETLPVGACWVPRILQKDPNTLRCYFVSQDPGKRQSQMWYRDFDLKLGEFSATIHKAKFKTAAGTFDFQPQHFHADAAAHGFKKKASDSFFFVFDSFKKFDGKLYVALNNFTGQQNALALVHDDLETFEVIGHYNEPQSAALSESAVNRLPDGTWMAICRNDKGNYHFTTSQDGKTWTIGEPKPFVPNGLNSKPTFDQFGGVYYLGWQEATSIQGANRSVFNVDISRDGRTWERKYCFETPQSFQYPAFHEHEGTIWLCVTQGDTDASRKERIMFGKLETVGEFETQQDQKRIEWPAPPAAAPAAFWDASKSVPRTAELPVLDGVEFHVIKRYEPKTDGYRFLHGVGLAWHEGKLHASFGHNQGAENTDTEEARVCTSADGGKTWNTVATMDRGDEPGIGVSHGVFLPLNGRLWAFHGAYSGTMKDVHTRAYLLDDESGRWLSKGTVIGGGFWPLGEPVRLADGNWIMAGVRAGGGNPAAVAISHGDDLTKWELVVIPLAKDLGEVWGESAVIVEGKRVTNIARWGKEARALVAVSEDYGRTWTPSQPSNLPMTTSKPCAGMLSTGQRFLVCSTSTDGGKRRSPLTIAVSKPGEEKLSKVFVIRHAEFPAGPGESHRNAALAYPCAIEHDGKLYVGYSNSGGGVGRVGTGRELWNNNSAELAVIPVEKLKANP